MDTDSLGNTALWLAAFNGHLRCITWLLEHGASFPEATICGQNIWNEVLRYFVTHYGDVAPLLRVMVLRASPPATFEARLSPAHAQIVREGARLRAGLPAYLVQRRALLDEHCPLLTPLRGLVYGYEEPTNAEDIWATGIDADSSKSESRT
jgi:hypothetical protein